MWSSSRTASKKVSSLESSSLAVGVAVLCFLTRSYLNRVTAEKHNESEEEIYMQSKDQDTFAWSRLLIRLWMRHNRRKNRLDSGSISSTSEEDLYILPIKCCNLMSSCHCKAISIQTRVESRCINILEGKECIRNFRYFIASVNNVQILNGEQDLSVYHDHSQTVHGFCRICGIQIFRMFGETEKNIEINADCLETQSMHDDPIECATQQQIKDKNASSDISRDVSIRLNDSTTKTLIVPSTPSTAISSSVFSQEWIGAHTFNLGSEDDPSFSTLSSPSRIAHTYTEESNQFHYLLEKDDDRRSANKKSRTKSLINPLASQQTVDQMKYYMKKYSTKYSN